MIQPKIMRKQGIGLILAVAVIALFAVFQSGVASAEHGAPVHRATVWVDGELFNTVVTPAEFDPANGNFDELYMGGDGFMGGVPLISDSKPGDDDYNGGRWHVNVLKETVDADKYVTATSVEDLDLDDFDAMDVYFECPLLPSRGANS